MREKFYIFLVLILTFAFTTKVFASLTFSTNAITGVSSSTIDLGTGNDLSIQTSGGHVIIGPGASTIDPANGVSLDVKSGAIYTQGAFGFYQNTETNPRLAIYRGGTDFFIFRNYNQQYTIMYVWAPPGALNVSNREASLTLQRGDDVNNEFLDIFNNGYNTGPNGADFSYGIRIQARGTGVIRPFAIQQSTVANVNTDLMTFAANKDVIIHSVNVSNALKVDGTTGNIGIGTATPLATLTVQADKTGYSAAQANTQLSLRGNTTTTKELILGYDTTNSYGLIQARDFGNSYSSLLLNPSGGNVGVGTAAPGAKLDVSNGHYASSQTTPPTPSVTGVGYSAASLGGGSTDTKGSITATVGAAAGTMVVTFQTAYASAPICTVTPATATAQVDSIKMYATSSISALTLNFVATPTGGSETYNYICLQ